MGFIHTTKGYKMKTPKVSVLMPAYNSEKYIAEAIESIMSQTFKDFEFIIINDGSTDNTAKIVSKYAERDKRIKFIDNKKNQGLIAVLNQGLDLCSGEYIARMDSDDISMPTRFEKQVEYMDTNLDVGVLGTSIEQFGALNQIYIYKPVISYIDLIHGCNVAHPTVFIRRDILQKYGIRYKSEYVHAEDYNLWSQLIKVTKIHNLTSVLFKYRWHDSNISVLFSDTQNQTTARIRREMLEFLTNVPEIQTKLKKLVRISHFFNPICLSKHMKKHHPIRYIRLKHTIDGYKNEVI